MDGYEYQMCYQCDGRGKVHYMVLFSRTCPRCKGRGKVRTPDFNWLKHSEPTLPRRPEGLYSARLQNMVSSQPPVHASSPAQPDNSLTRTFKPAALNILTQPHQTSNSTHTQPIVIQPPHKPFPKH